MLKFLPFLPPLIAGFLTFIVTPFFTFKYHAVLITSLIIISIFLFIVSYFWSKLIKKLKTINDKNLNMLINNFSNVKNGIFFNCAVVYGITILISQIENFYFTFNIQFYSFYCILNFDFLWFISILLAYYLLRAVFRIGKAIYYIKNLKTF